MRKKIQSQSFGQVPRAQSTPATARADTITAIMVLIIIFKILNSSVKISSRYGAWVTCIASKIFEHSKLLPKTNSLAEWDYSKKIFFRLNLRKKWKKIINFYAVPAWKGGAELTHHLCTQDKAVFMMYSLIHSQQLFSVSVVYYWNR